jgi:GNAT superfamily N-acetyltransferase
VQTRLRLAALPGASYALQRDRLVSAETAARRLSGRTFRSDAGRTPIFKCAQGAASIGRVAPDWQGTGLGGALQQRLREHAIGQGVRGFIAETLPQNERMIRLAKSATGRTKVEYDEEGVRVTTWFSEYE